VFDVQTRLEMGFDKDGHALPQKDSKADGQWMWFPKKMNPDAPVTRNIKPSFGGVIDLFQDANASTKSHPAQASFGGVMDLFGQHQQDQDEVAPVEEAPPQRKRDPSFGGIADMFADDEHSSPSEEDLSNEQSQQKTSNVGEMLEDETFDQPLPDTAYQKKRDPSFSGINDLFGDDADDEVEEDRISPLADEDKISKESFEQRSGRKRDPSYGGIADMFADDEQSSEEVEERNYKESTKDYWAQRQAQAEAENHNNSSNHNKKISVGFGISIHSFSDKFNETAPPPETSPPQPSETPPRIQTKIVHDPKQIKRIQELEEKLKDAENSKRRLVKSVGEEFEKMRNVIRSLSLQVTSVKETWPSTLSSFFFG